MSTEPPINTFAINPEGGPDIVVEGSRRFAYEHEVAAYKAWAKAEVARLREAAEPFLRAAEGLPASEHDAKPLADVTSDARCPGTFTRLTMKDLRRLGEAFGVVR